MKFCYKVLLALSFLPASMTAIEQNLSISLTIRNSFPAPALAQAPPVLDNSTNSLSVSPITYASPTLNRAGDYLDKAETLYEAGKFSDAEYLLLDTLEFLSSNGLQPYVFQNPSTRVEERSFKIFGWTLFKSRRVVSLGQHRFSTTASIDGLYNQIILDLANRVDPIGSIFDYAARAMDALVDTFGQSDPEDLFTGNIPAPEPVNIDASVRDLDTNNLKDAHRIELDILNLFQKTLIAQDDPVKLEQALEIAELARNVESIRLLPAVAYALNKSILESNSRNGNIPEFVVSDNLSADEIKEIAAREAATLVLFSITDNTEVIVWTVKPNGDIKAQTINLVPNQISLDELAKQTLLAAGSYVNRGEDDFVLVEALRTPNFPGQETLRWENVPDELKITETDQRSALQSLHSLLIAPIIDELPKETGGKIIFVPQTSLLSVPFAALESPSGESLIDRYTIRVSPNLQYLQRERPPLKRFPRGNEALIVGNPSNPSVSSLPGAGQEALDIASLIGTTPLIEDQATVSPVRQRLGDAKVVHFAAHGILDAQIDPREIVLLLNETEGRNTRFGVVVGGVPETLPPQPVSYSLWPDSAEVGRWHVIRIVGSLPGAIVLANSSLTSQDALNLSLAADLVVLSACNTNRGLPSESNLLGLPMALGVAGVPQVVASLWAVPDEATQLLMFEFYEAMQRQDRDIDVAYALREAMIKVKSIEKYNDPIYWAGFTVIDVSK